MLIYWSSYVRFIFRRVITVMLSLCLDLDNSDANERLKFSILKRLPEVLLTVEKKFYTNLSVYVKGSIQRS